MDPGQKDKPRRRDAAATRRALLTAARVLVAQRGVEGTSTRDVAAAAGVNQALVYRYFGSKEKLFAEALAGGPNKTEEVIAETPLADLPHVLLGHMLGMGADRAAFSVFVTAANDETIRTVIRERIDAGFGAALAARLDGPDAALRAELLAALITGIGYLREKVGTPAILGADPETLGKYADRMADALLTEVVPG
jgi:AcrR family transcriptional regulator